KYRLIATQHRETSEQQSVGIEFYSVQSHSRQRQAVGKDAEQDQYYPRHEEQSARSTEQKKPQSSPAVAESIEMRRAQLPTIRMKRDRHLSGFAAEQGRFNDHLGCEFHPGASLIQSLVMRLREASHPAVDVLYRRMEP